MHHKKSEIQIRKESRGVSSDYNRNPQIHCHQQQDKQLLQEEALSKAHKRPVGFQRSPSSGMMRSPTVKDSIQTLDCFNGALLQNHNRHWWFCNNGGNLAKRLGMRGNLLSPLVIVVAVPCLWWCFREIATESDSEATAVSLWFDFFAVSVLCAGVVVCFRIAFPSFAGLVVYASVAALKERYKVAKIVRVWKVFHSPLIWRIGSKPKVECDIESLFEDGVEVYSNGDVYEGEFYKGKHSGRGVYHYCLSGRYEGDWVDGKYDGYGVETWAKGSRYRGQYRQGLRHGYGVYRFYTGDVYAGEWCSGHSHGYGVHTCEDGSRYVGEFKFGVKQGLGYYHFRNGDTYSGEYIADRMHGFGVYKFANGDCYEGSWYEGAKHGLGMYTFRNGESYCGNWNHGALDTLSSHSIQPGSPIAVNHSKVLNAVQEARHAAEKAFKVPHVDEKVKRAISAANRSANAARVSAVRAVQKRMHHKWCTAV